MKSIKLIIILFLFLSIYSKAQLFKDSIITKRINYLSDNKKQTVLDSLVDKSTVDFMQSPQNCGLSIGIIKDGEFYFYNYGEIKRNKKQLPTNNTIFEIGSVTKTFCGIILAYAVIEGKIKFDDDVRKFLPEKFPNLETDKQFIEVKHLANHTSGLPSIPENMKFQENYDSLNPYKNYTKEMMFNYLKKVKLVSEPGKINKYSNYGMALLGIILENVYNKSFDEIVKEKICTANNMNNTAINLNSTQLNLLADGHNADGEILPHWDLGDFASAGGIKSSAFDMLNYLNYNLNEKDDAAKLAHTTTINYDSNIALAWHIIKTKQGNDFVWHNGGTFGFSSFCGFIKEKKCALIILSNTATSIDYIGLSILNFLQK